jgi:AraC family transcriptional regulator of adaptative response / methylphosphotriester-DNA alkyltransferase methyltransferase
MREEQWEAILKCDPLYDGIFYYAVNTTGIFCRPSCKSRTPRKENVIIFETAQAALAAGFRPCKRCRPDHPLGPDEELVRRTMTYIEAHYSEPLTLAAIAARQYVNPHHLHRTFKRRVGITPTQYLLHKRMSEAKRLLSTSALSITAISAVVGFTNVAHFSAVFHKQVGLSPSAYRNKMSDISLPT